MTSYASPQGLLSDQYAGAFSPRQGLLADPAMMMQAMQAAKSMGLLDGMGGMGNDSVLKPPVDPAMAGQPMGGPLPNAPAPPMMAPGMGGPKPGGMGGGMTLPAQATGGPGFPARNIPSGYAMPIAPRASLDSIYGMYAPAASAEGKLPPMGLGGLRRMYASPETLKAEADAAAAAAASKPTYDGYGPNGRPYDAGGGDGQGTQAGTQQEGGLGAASTGTSAGVGGGAGQSGGLGGASAGATGGDPADNGSNTSADPARRGKYLKPDGDGVMEEVPIRAHEGEVILNPEATSLLGPDKLMAFNRMALRKKRRGLLDD